MRLCSNSHISHDLRQLQLMRNEFLLRLTTIPKRSLLANYA
jgi:hypothetical protein